MVKRSGKGKSVSWKNASSDRQPRSCALLVPFISMVDVILFILTMYINDCPGHSDHCILEFLRRFSFQPFEQNPLIGPSRSALWKMGGLSSASGIHGHQFWRVFTCIWLHAGLIHLFVNLCSLLFVGIRLEQRFGCEKVGGILFLSGFGGSLFAEMFLEHQVSAGASIPLFGLLGAMLSELIINWSVYEKKCPPFIIFVLLFVVNLGIGIFPFNDNFSHIGGFTFGFLLGFVFLMQPQNDWAYVARPYEVKTQTASKYRAYQIFLWVAALLFLVIGYFMDIFLAIRGVNGSATCSWCHYLTCVPSSWWNCDSGGGGDRRATCSVSVNKFCGMSCFSHHHTSCIQCDLKKLFISLLQYVISGNYMYMRCENNQRTQLYNGIFPPSSLKLLCSKLCS